jgi:YesN/AraC family two-component response regulator
MSQKKEKIRTLIVDDDADFRQILKSHLEFQSMITIVGEAGDGKEALKKTVELKPDLVLMDIRMPHENGIVATHKIKKNLKTKVIVLSGYEIDEYKEAVFSAGAEDYVVKRKMLAELMPSIQKAFQNGSRGVSESDNKNGFLE